MTMLRLSRRPLRSTLVTLAAAALVTTLSAAPALALGAPGTAPSSASTSAVQWTVTPATGDAPDDRISLRHVLDVGVGVQDAIAVSNTGSVAATFEVQAGDGIVTTDGAFDIAAGEPTASGSWVEIGGLDAGTISLGAGETRVLPVTITAPQNATPGDHPAGIVVALAQGDDSVAVQHRIGVRLHLQVSGDLTPALAVSDLSTHYEPSLNPFAPGILTVSYVVRNEGNLRLGAGEAVTAAGPLGWGTASMQGTEAAELLPGDTMTRTHTLEAYPLAVLTGGVTVAPVALGSDVVELPPATTTGFSAIAVPWAALIALLVVVAIVLLVRRFAGRAAARRQEAIDAAVAAALADAKA